MQKVTVTTPGKLIITGEHAVVFGCPALAIPSHLCVTGTILPLPTQTVELNSALIHQEMDLANLANFKAKIDLNYQAFVLGQIPINAVLPNPEALLFYTVAAFANQHKTPQGFKISLNSEIPIGAGMGSSAAVIVTILTLLYKACNLEQSDAQLLTLAKQCENLQHGHSSGLDIAVAVSQTPILYQNAMISPFKPAGFGIYIVHTGIPNSTTGECVNFVKTKFDNPLKEKFTTISNQILKGLTDKNLQLFKDAVHKNQLLLEKLGVVPDQIIEFRKALQTQYLASFKISGAGSLLGDAAGMGLIVSEHNPTALCLAHGYQIWKVNI